MTTGVPMTTRFTFRTKCICSDCDGVGRVPVKSRDSDVVFEIGCAECGGTGEVYVEPATDDDMEDA